MTALEGVSVEIREGEVHAVLGENGAGKSTLMGLLAGHLVPDSGTLAIGGEPAAWGDPGAMRRAGLALVHQHFQLVPAFTVAENLALDSLGTLGGVLDLAGVVENAREAAAKVGWSFDPSAPTGSLPVGVQQRIEITKALATDARIIILDEPTAVLAPDEVLDLIRVLKSLREQGRAVVLIAHKLSEVFAVADRVTVLRRGRLSGEGRIGEVTEDQVARMMVGDLPDIWTPSERPLGETVLELRNAEVKGDRGETAVRGVSMTVRAGEIVGIGGVDGNGQIELAEALALVRPLSSGERIGADEPAYIPQDRQVDGLALDMSIWENMLISTKIPQTGSVRRGRVQGWAQGLVERFGIRLGSLDDPVRSLSGGNQQKVVVARTLSAGPRLIIAVNPTRGLDLKAASFVRESLQSAAADGAAVVLFSADLDELAQLADRSWFMSSGRLTQADAAGLTGGRT
ncbi:MAG: ATP-binding cassette domain-containing protein [Fimbriimonadaceae bacterium]|nr:ATP-binding cassette domain-containing protein [Fimbriimonadaceae bacterium]